MTKIVPRNTFTIGEKAAFSRTITEADIIAYAGFSGDFNPLHVDAALKNEFSSRRNVPLSMSQSV